MADLLQQFRDRADAARVVTLGQSLDVLCEDYSNGEVLLALIAKLLLMARHITEDEMRDMYLGTLEKVLSLKGMREGGHRVRATS